MSYILRDHCNNGYMYSVGHRMWPYDYFIRNEYFLVKEVCKCSYSCACVSYFLQGCMQQQIFQLNLPVWDSHFLRDVVLFSEVKNVCSIRCMSFAERLLLS